LCYVHILCFLLFGTVLFYYFAPKCFALAVTAVSAELRAAKLDNFYAALSLVILRTLANYSAQNSARAE